MINSKVIKLVHLFTGLSTSEIDQIAAISAVQEGAPGDVIIEQNSTGNEVYMIAEGSVEVFIRGLPGRPQNEAPVGGQHNEQILVILGRGQIFGEMALIDQGYRSASVRAGKEGCTLYQFDKDSFRVLCQENNHIGFTVMRNLAIDLAFKLRHRNLAQM